MTDPTDNMVNIPGGEFSMGSADFYVEEQPVHTVSVSAFRMDVTPVTNDDFARFVDATGYTTVAERDLNADDYPGVAPEDLAAGSLVFTPTDGPVDLGNPGHWWRFVKGVQWRMPDGETPTAGQHPVVQIAYEDAEAYADWIGKSLPTEAEWEYAARGGLDRAVFPWGNEFSPNGQVMANTWEGDFPWRNSAEDSATNGATRTSRGFVRTSRGFTRTSRGFVRTSPVGSYPANGYGLYDMVGNVWEWTLDWWSSTHLASHETACCAPSNPRGGERKDSFDPQQPEINIPQKVLKGGSHLCAANYCLRYRPAARIPQMIDSATSHLGFRCVIRDHQA